MIDNIKAEINELTVKMSACMQDNAFIEIDNLLDQQVALIAELVNATAMDSSHGDLYSYLESVLQHNQLCMQQMEAVRDELKISLQNYGRVKLYAEFCP